MTKIDGLLTEEGAAAENYNCPGTSTLLGPTSAARASCLCVCRPPNMLTCSALPPGQPAGLDTDPTVSAGSSAR